MVNTRNALWGKRRAIVTRYALEGRRSVGAGGCMKAAAMIDIRSDALAANLVARGVDFFSIGTNDLIQHTIAVDRLNEHIAHLYEPTHPPVIRLLRMIVDAGRAHNVWVGICGEMAGDVTLPPASRAAP